jgi:hypothetical protein
MIRLTKLVDFGKAFTPTHDHVPDEVIPEKREGDHEVGMAHNLLDDIIRSATELKEKMGSVEKDVPAWIQDHISQAQSFISQANVNYHEYDTPETTAVESVTEGTENVAVASPPHNETDTPWVMASWMKKNGYRSHGEG